MSRSIFSAFIVSITLLATGQGLPNPGTGPLRNHHAAVHFASTTVRVLTSAAAYDDEFPFYSPDGKFVVFSRRLVNGRGNSRLWIIPAAGGEARPLTPAEFPLQCTRPAYSPDGKLIAFRAARKDENAGGIWLIGADGRGLRRLTDEEKADDVYPTWAPDSSYIVFSRGLITQEPSNNLWEVRPDGWQKQLTRGDKFDGKATVSPDGAKIAFSTDRPDRHYPDTSIWIMSVAGGEESAKPFAADTGAGPAWSPDGHWIAFSSHRDGGVYIESAGDGAIIGASNSTGTVAENAHPAWSPDGCWIVFDKADSDSHHHLEVLSVPELLKDAQ
jgi:Tol biopolymer transport system component